VALTGALIRLGNFFNSEIIGKPTDSPIGVVFANRFTETIQDKEVDDTNYVDDVAIQKSPGSISETGRVPLNIYLFFRQGVEERDARAFAQYKASQILEVTADEHFDHQSQDSNIEVIKENSGSFAAKIPTYGIARHPAQLYESIACVILFALLYAIWNHYKAALPPGRLLGIFLIWCFGLRFLFEFLKENQVSFEDTLPINMGQILSIPLIIAGIIILVLSYRKKPV
jgi:prolipoprotein diacylglyceryltransferase